MNERKSNWYFLLLILYFCFLGCDSEGEDYPFASKGEGEIKAIVLNEGLFSTNTGALSLIYEDGEVVPDVFQSVNYRPLGDIAQSMTKINGNYFVALNNSKKIEIVDPRTFRSLGTICYSQTGYPRQIVAISPTEAIVSDLERQLVRIRTVPPYGNTLEFISIDHSVEYLVVADNKLFGITSGGMYVFDIDHICKERARFITEVRNEEVTKSCQLLVDYRGYIWAFMHEKEGMAVAAVVLVRVDPKTEKVIESYRLPICKSGCSMPGDVVGSIDYNRIDMDSTKHWIYFNVKTHFNASHEGEDDVQQSVYRMCVDTGEFELYRHLPGTNMMYGFAVDSSGDVYVCDCLDYTAQRGYVRKYMEDGTILNYRVGVYPNQIYFPE